MKSCAILWQLVQYVKQRKANPLAVSNMKLLLAYLSEKYGIGKHPITEQDCYRIAETEGIEIIWSEKKYSFYFHALGEHCIVLPKRKRGLHLLYDFLHELGHYFAHAGEDVAASFAIGHTKDEFEADVIALVALIPKHQIQRFASEYGQTRFGDKLWRERCRLYFLYGI